MAFANGRIPAAFLVQAANGAPGQLLEAQTAKQWAAMVAAAARDGITLRPQADGDVPSCYRDIAGQERAAEEEARGGPTAATVGESPHGLGTAIDIYMGPGVFAWLSAHAAEFGFDNAQGKASGENWHWVRTRVVSVITNTITEQIMALRDTLEIFHSDRGYFLAGPGMYYPIGDKDGLEGTKKLDALGAIDIPVTELPVGQWDALNIIWAGNQYIYSTAQVAAAEVKK